jgi:hypothetical protein
MTLAEEIDELDLVLGRVALGKTDLERSRQRLDGSLESHRIALLRADTLPGDVLERALKARYELYLSAIDFVDTVQRAEAAQIDAYSYGKVCEGADPATGLDQNLVGLLSRPFSGKRVSIEAPKGELSWFLWRGEPLLKSESLPLPMEGGRLLVSFTREQLSAIASDATTAQFLRQNLDRLHSSGWKVDLVFGDASFVLPQGREKLVRFVRDMASFAFDGLNLDLERNDLPEAIQHKWWHFTLQTLRSVHQATSLPITLTTHHREFDRQPMFVDLQKVGVRSTMAMIYVSDLTTVTEISHRILTRQPNLSISVVQSVEPELSSSESGFKIGRKANLLQWKEVSERLAVMPNFAGIAVQSLETFNAMEP